MLLACCRPGTRRLYERVPLGQRRQGLDAGPAHRRDVSHAPAGHIPGLPAAPVAAGESPVLVSLPSAAAGEATAWPAVHRRDIGGAAQLHPADEDGLVSPSQGTLVDTLNSTSLGKITGKTITDKIYQLFLRQKSIYQICNQYSFT